MNFKNYLANCIKSVIIKLIRYIKRKETMTKLNPKNEKTEAVFAEVTDAPIAKLTRFMVGTYNDPVSGEWMLAYIKFDPITKTVGEIKTERVSGDEEVLRERLVIRQGQLGLLDRGESTDMVKNDLY